MYIVVVSPSIWTVLCIMRSLAFPTLYRFFMFIVFNIIIRNIFVFWCYNILLCFTFKICSLMIIFRKILRIISKTFIRLKTFSLLIKFSCSLILLFRYAFSLFTQFITKVDFSHCLFKGLWIIKFNSILELVGKQLRNLCILGFSSII